MVAYTSMALTEPGIVHRSKRMSKVMVKGIAILAVISGRQHETELLKQDA